MRTEDIIRAVLLNLDILKEKAYRGDYDALTLLLDLENAITHAGLTDRQQNVVHLTYYKHRKQKETAKELGVTQQTVSSGKRTAIRKIAKVYEQQGELTT